MAVSVGAVIGLAMPLTVLPILDGLMFLAPSWQVARDFGLLLWVWLLPCTLLATLAWGCRSRPMVAWTVLLLPLLLLLLRQAARVLLQWLNTVGPSALKPSPEAKLLGLLLVGLMLLIWMRRAGWQASITRVVGLLEAMRGPAILLLLSTTALIVWQPPSWKPLSSTPVPISGTVGSGPNLLVIALDTVSMADADACNPASITMPQLARFAQQASCFSRYQTAANFTTASVASLESGLLPWTHRAAQPDAAMHAATRGHTLAHALHLAGWRTHFITDNLLASPLHRGSFAPYDSTLLSSTELWIDLPRFAAARFAGTALPRLLATSLAILAPIDQWRLQERSPYRSEAVYDDLLRLLNSEQSNGRPQFVFALTLPPHDPYLPPLSTRYTLLPAGKLDRLSDLLPSHSAYHSAQQALVDQHRLRYRESLMAADAALGEALQRLDQEGRLANTVVVVTTDHGESFEKGYIGHAGPLLHQSLVHGPLVIRLPGQTTGQVIDMPVSQVDLAPTLLDLVGAKPLAQAEGRSLKPLLEGRELPARPVFSMALEHQRPDTPLKHGRVAVIDGRWKLVLGLSDGAVQLFDLDRDPSELRDLSAQHPSEVQRLRLLIQARKSEAEQRLAALHP